MGAFKFEWNPSAYQALIDGPILNNLTQRAIRVEQAAKQNATERPGPNVRTGRLRGSITWRQGRSDAGARYPVYVDIGSNLVYSIFVERGHNVVRNGRIVGYAPPRPYLLPALSAARTT